MGKKKKTYYTILIWSAYTSELSGKLEFGNAIENTNLELKSIADAEKIIKIANIKYWQIEEHNDDVWRGKVVKQSPEIKAYLNEQERQSKLFHKKQKAIAAKINKMPNKFYIPMPKGFKGKVYIERSEAEYDPKYSRSVRYSLNLMIAVDGHKKGTEFYFYSYLAETYGGPRKYLTKKFAIQARYEIGEENAERFKGREKEILSTIIGTYDRVKKMLEKGINPDPIAVLKK